MINFETVVQILIIDTSLESKFALTKVKFIRDLTPKLRLFISETASNIIEYGSNVKNTASGHIVLNKRKHCSNVNHITNCDRFRSVLELNSTVICMDLRSTKLRFDFLESNDSCIFRTAILQLCR